VFAEGFEKIAGKIGRRINAFAKQIGMGRGTQADHRSHVANQIVGARRVLRETGDKGISSTSVSSWGGALSLSGNKVGRMKVMKTTVHVPRTGTTKKFRVEGD
jgi:hypothetical protein